MFEKIVGYHPNKDKNNTKDASNLDDNKKISKISEVIFSSALSLFLSFLGRMYFLSGKPTDFKSVLSLYFAAISVYIVLFILIRILYKIGACLFDKVFNLLRYTKLNTTPQKNEELIGEFDSIVINNLKKAQRYFDEIPNGLGEAYYTLSFHNGLKCLQIAVEKTKEIIIPERQEECINICKNTRGIDLFCLQNAYHIMVELYKKLNKKLNDYPIQKYDYESEKQLDFKISFLDESINEIGEAISKIINNPKL